jgi:hypothetical protein
MPNMYGRKAPQARTQVPSRASVLVLTPNYAQASLGKTARPVLCSWSGYKNGVLPAEFYGPRRTGLACTRLTAAKVSGRMGLSQHCSNDLCSAAQCQQCDYTTAWLCNHPIAEMCGFCAMRRNRDGAVPRSHSRAFSVLRTPHQSWAVSRLRDTSCPCSGLSKARLGEHGRTSSFSSLPKFPWPGNVNVQQGIV